MKVIKDFVMHVLYFLAAILLTLLIYFSIVGISKVFINNSNKTKIESALKFKQLIKIKSGFYENCVGQLRDKITEDNKELFLINIQFCKIDSVGDITERFVYVNESQLEILIN